MEYSFSDVRIAELDTMYVARSYAISNNPEDDVITFMTKWIKNNRSWLVIFYQLLSKHRNSFCVY
jgi:hypothetical protein